MRAPFAVLLAAILLVGVTLASLVSLFFTFKAVSPFLKSPKDPLDYHSAVFFGHVTEHDDPAKYLAQVKDLDEEKAIKDLAYQARELARGAAGKFRSIKLAIGAILFAEIPMFALLVVLALAMLIARQYTG